MSLRRFQLQWYNVRYFFQTNHTEKNGAGTLNPNQVWQFPSAFWSGYVCPFVDDAVHLLSVLTPSRVSSVLPMAHSG